MPQFQNNIASTYHIILHHINLYIFRIFLYSQIYTETGAFSTQNFTTLLNVAIVRGKSKLHQQTNSEKFSKISEHTKKYGKNYNGLPQELKKYLSSK